MTKVDFVFYILGIFCYFSLIYQMRNQQVRAVEYSDLQKKKELYANRMIEQKRRESLAKNVEERRRRSKIDIKSMTSTVEMLSNLADKEIMRQTRITRDK